MDEKQGNTTTGPSNGDHGAPGNGRPRAQAEVLRFPDLLGERRSAACAVIRDELDGLPDFRMEKVQDAQEKIRERFYERPEVLEKILRRLVADIAMPE
jgi:hypothetical protein